MPVSSTSMRTAVPCSVRRRRTCGPVGGEFERVGDKMLQELLAENGVHFQGDRLARGRDGQVDALLARLLVPRFAQPAGKGHQVGVDALEFGLAVLHTVECPRCIGELLALSTTVPRNSSRCEGEIASPLRRTISV